MPVGEATLGRIMNVIGEPVDQKGPIATVQALADPSRGADVHRPGDAGAGLRDRHQGGRPARALSARRQDRPLRRRRRRQDGHHPGADQQRRQAARRRVGVRRRRRAHARGQRPLPRDAGVEALRRQPGHLAHRAGVRPDERAAGRARPRRPDGAHRGRALPRRGGQGRPPLHRQHLPLRAGQLRGVRAARPHALGRGLPAHAGHRHRRAPGAHHHDQDAARSRRCRRSTCPPTT